GVPDQLSEEWSGEWEMVNPERSWNGVIECLEHEGEIAAAPLHTYNIELLPKK
ncbi:hypothetical protein M9458_054764, partial [Cirrhinus mrigala]